MLDYIWDITECDKSVPMQNNTFKVAPQRDIQDHPMLAFATSLTMSALKNNGFPCQPVS